MQSLKHTINYKLFYITDKLKGCHRFREKDIEERSVLQILKSSVRWYDITIQDSSFLKRDRWYDVIGRDEILPSRQIAHNFGRSDGLSLMPYLKEQLTTHIEKST